MTELSFDGRSLRNSHEYWHILYIFRNYTVSQKKRQLWNGITQKYKDQFWWTLEEIFKILQNRVCKPQFSYRFAFYQLFNLSNRTPKITWRFGGRSSKVTDIGANQKPVCDFLLVCNSNLGPILHHFGDFAAAFMCSWLHPHSTLILGVFPLHQIAHVGATKRMGLKLFGREIIFEIFQPMWSRYLNVTDRQTDRKTDRQRDWLGRCLLFIVSCLPREVFSSTQFSSSQLLPRPSQSRNCEHEYKNQSHKNSNI